MYKSFVSAAEGNRDSYELAIALAQHNILEKHITDFYTPNQLIKYFSFLKNNSLFQKFLSRNSILLSSNKVHISKKMLSYFLIRYVFFKKANIIPNLNQNLLSKIALDVANNNNAGLFLYAGYAFNAFRKDKRKDRPKILIQYHPHIDQSSKIILRDLEKYKYLTNAYDQIKNDMKDLTNLPELKLSDTIICHSKFTEETVINAGIPKEKIITFPYGINSKITKFKSKPELNKDKKCNFLFVGQGIHRKGLHHLLMAWKKADLKFSILNIVSRYVDPQIKMNAKMADNVNFLKNIGRKEKKSIFQKSDVFVMPSIIEGFGYVYLEAFSYGLFCIGTNNTGLRDISSIKTSRILEVGDIENLSLILNELQDIVLTKGIDRKMIKSSIKSYTWECYREKIATSAKDTLFKRV